MSKRSEAAALKAIPIEDNRSFFGFSLEYSNRIARREGFVEGYEQAEKNIVSIIESRLAELLGDAQPTPILRYELRDLIKKIKGEEK